MPARISVPPDAWRASSQRRASVRAEAVAATGFRRHRRGLVREGDQLEPVGLAEALDERRHHGPGLGERRAVHRAARVEEHGQVPRKRPLRDARAAPA